MMHDPPLSQQRTKEAHQKSKSRSLRNSRGIWNANLPLFSICTVMRMTQCARQTAKRDLLPGKHERSLFSEMHANSRRGQVDDNIIILLSRKYVNPCTPSFCWQPIDWDPFRTMSSSSKKRSILKKHKTLQESLDSKYGVVVAWWWWWRRTGNKE